MSDDDGDPIGAPRYHYSEEEYGEVLERLRERWRAKHPPNLRNSDVTALLERIYGPTHPELQDYQLVPGAFERLERRGLIGRSGRPVRNQYGSEHQQEHLLGVLAVLEHRMQAGVGVGLPWTATVTLIHAANRRALDPRIR